MDQSDAKQVEGITSSMQTCPALRERTWLLPCLVTTAVSGIPLVLYLRTQPTIYPVAHIKAQFPRCLWGVTSLILASPIPTLRDVKSHNPDRSLCSVPKGALIPADVQSLSSQRSDNIG